MKSLLNKLITSLFTLLVLVPSKPAMAQPKYEFRGVWIATVANIDFPSDKFENSDSIRQEFIHLLDLCQR